MSLRKISRMTRGLTWDPSHCRVMSHSLVGSESLLNVHDVKNAYLHLHNPSPQSLSTVVLGITATPQHTINLIHSHQTHNMTRSNTSTCVTSETCVSSPRKSKRKTAGRNPARYVDSSDIDEPTRPMQELCVQKTGDKSSALCGATKCRKQVSDGIECSNCLLWFHPSCAKLSEEDFLSHSADEDSLWFCEHCLLNPILRYLTLIIRKQTKTISSLEDRVRKLEKTVEPPHSTDTFVRISEAKEITCPVQSAKVPCTSEATRTACVQQIPPKTKSSKEDLTIICTHVPESQHLSLKDRHQDELKHWTDVCRNMNLTIVPKSLTRLPRPPSSPHSGEPRLLRVTLQSQNDIEEVLLSAHLLKESGSNVRIFPDIPWHERRKRQTDPQSAKTEEMKKAIFIHGIPESTEINPFRKLEHDRREWQFVQELLGAEGCVTTSLIRLRPSPNYKGTGPRILKATLLSEDMVETLISSWSIRKRLMPPELRLRAALSPNPSSKPASLKLQTDGNEDAQPDNDFGSSASKNDPTPVSVPKN